MSSFKAESITKVFGEGQNSLTVLSGLDLQLESGEMIAIIGASGTGKTTLLNILGTLERPTSGSITFQGEDVFSRNDFYLSRFRNKTIGFVFQFHHLLPEFTALENVMLPGFIAGVEKEKIETESSDLLTKVGLGQRILHRVGELSGGEQQRVALARALIMKPALLLADEPTGNLDPETGNKVFELIEKLNNDFSLSTVMVTHNQELARRMDRCLVLSNGKLSTM
jgi:lipoprotein-releasing system ATP-binding protein